MLVLGKSHVKSSVTGDILEGVDNGPIPFAPVHGYQPADNTGLAIELGGPWSFYRKFWKAHSLDHLSELLATPEVALSPGERLHLPLLLHNGSAGPHEVTLTAEVPGGWTIAAGQAIYPVDAGETYPVQSVLAPPAKAGSAWQEVTWKAESGGKTIGTVSVRVNFATGGLPQ